ADLDGSVTDGDATVSMTSGTGTCNVFYDQAGNANFNPAPQVQEDVTATDSPVFTSANHTSFDLGFASTFNITATGNPSTMVISVAGTLPSGITLTDNGDGTASFDGIPGAGTVGVYNLVLTANNGILPNGTQNFTLTIRNGPIASNINSMPDTGDGSLTENESVANTLGINQLTVEFSQDVHDVPASTTDPEEVDNPANYILVRSATGIFNTLNCAGGVVAPDIITPVTSVTYDNGGGSGPFIATVTLSTPLTTDGHYRLFVCGTTSIVDAVNPSLILAGNGTTPGTDFIRNFQLVPPAVAGGGGGGGGTGKNTTALTVAALPATGFAPNRVTILPEQPADLAYSDLGDLWIEIPSLGVKTSIVGVPMAKEGEWDVTWLGNNVGWLDGTAFPSWEGNSVLTAHVTNASGLDGPFAKLTKLKYGDQIIVHAFGQKYIFEIRDSRVTKPFATSYAFEHLEDESYLTLITCQVYLPKSDTYLYRRVVRAVLVSVKSE
ncbi:MAG TPA: sortase, partial [Anaerolineales bacterium]|nr:sortase [Anaerolineales bacterium]